MSEKNRVITSSFDGYMKVYKSDSLEVTYQEKMETGIVGFDVGAGGLALMLGLENKKIILKTRHDAANEDGDEEEK